MPARKDFDLAALHAALDAQRQARGLSWVALAREINARFEKLATATRPMSPSTISGVGRRAAAEGDGVLQMLAWLDRTPESFVPGQPLADAPQAALPDVPSHQILRWDALAVHRALDLQRRERGMTWAQVAADIGGCVPASLTGLATAQRVSFPFIMRAVGWLGRPAAEFTRAAPF